MKNAIYLMIAACFCIAVGTFLTGKGNTAHASEAASETQIAQTGYTAAVPTAYRESSARPGKVTRLEYDSEDYVRDSAPITKTAYFEVSTETFDNPG